MFAITAQMKQHGRRTQHGPRVKIARPTNTPIVVDVSEEHPFALLEGETHINIDVASRTTLGRMLANAYECKFNHPVYGTFGSVESFWYFVRGGFKDRDIGSMRNTHARKQGQNTERVFVSDFPAIIMEACYFKVAQNAAIRNEVLDSTLPFDQYYIQCIGRGSRKNGLLMRTKTHRWVCFGYSYIRDCLLQSKRFDINEFRSLLIDQKITS